MVVDSRGGVAWVHDYYFCCCFVVNSPIKSVVLLFVNIFLGLWRKYGSAHWVVFLSLVVNYFFPRCWVRERFFFTSGKSVKLNVGVVWGGRLKGIFCSCVMRVAWACVIILLYSGVCVFSSDIKNCTVQLTCSIFVLFRREYLNLFLSFFFTNNRGLRYKRVPYWIFE